MKKIRKISANSFLVVLLCISFLFVCCSKDQMLAPPSLLTGKDLMAAIFFADGPALEKIPELKKSINISLFINDATQLEDIRKAYGLLLDKLEENERGSFSDFKSKIESGDHIVIEETINLYGNKITNLLKSEYGLKVYNQLVQNQKKFVKVISKYESHPSNQYSVKKLVDNPEFIKEFTSVYNEIKEQSLSGKVASTESTTCVWLFAGAVAWVVVVYAVLAWVFFWTGVEVDWDFGASYAINPKGSLLKDQVVNSIAVNLTTVGK